MADNQYSWFSLLKKIIEFFGYLFSFCRGRKQVNEEKEKDKFDKTIIDLKNSYNEIDKEKQDKGKDDLDKRIKNMF